MLEISAVFFRLVKNYASTECSLATLRQNSHNGSFPISKEITASAIKTAANVLPIYTSESDEPTKEGDAAYILASDLIRLLIQSKKIKGLLEPDSSKTVIIPVRIQTDGTLTSPNSSYV